MPYQNVDFTVATTVQKRITEHSRAQNLTLYAEAQSKGISFTELLEELDPSPRTPDGKLDSPIDAFERQLVLSGVVTKGRNTITLGQFMTGPGLLLLPEFITRAVQEGYNLVQDPTELVAAIVPVEGPSVRPMYVVTTPAKQALAARAQEAGYPVAKIMYRTKDVAIVDRGRQFDFSYRVLKDQKLPEFVIFLQWMGAQIAYDELGEIYLCCLNGDGTSPAATNVFAGGAGTWAYSDIVHLSMAFTGPHKMTHILALAADIEKTLNLTQFQDAAAWRAIELFERSGDYRSFLPLHSKLVVVPGATATKIIGLDARFCIRESVAQPLMIEAEKIITQKFETAVVSKESVYTIMIDDACKLSDY